MICRQHLHKLSLVSPAWTLLAHKTSGDCDVRRRRPLDLHIRLLEIATFGDVDPWPLKHLNQMSLYAKKAV